MLEDVDELLGVERVDVLLLELERVDVLLLELDEDGKHCE